MHKYKPFLMMFKARHIPSCRPVVQKHIFLNDYVAVRRTNLSNHNNVCRKIYLSSRWIYHNRSNSCSPRHVLNIKRVCTICFKCINWIRYCRIWHRLHRRAMLKHIFAYSIFSNLEHTFYLFCVKCKLTNKLLLIFLSGNFLFKQL